MDVILRRHPNRNVFLSHTLYKKHCYFGLFEKSLAGRPPNPINEDAVIQATEDEPKDSKQNVRVLIISNSTSNFER